MLGGVVGTGTSSKLKQIKKKKKKEFVLLVPSDIPLPCSGIGFQNICFTIY